MPSFFHNLADKAQSAINASPLAGKIPVPGSASAGAPRPPSPDPAPQPAANQAAAQGGGRSHALDALSYQFRAFQQQYSSSTSPAQKIITAEKGLALDYDNVARESKAQSKELYTWGQTEADDMKDVTDRLAYLNFVLGSASFTLSQKLDAARAPFKALRDAEIALQPRRNIRAGIEKELARVENDPKKAGDFKDQLRKAELEDAEKEREVEILKRKALRDSEQLKWTAIQEASAAGPLLAELPSVPPGSATPYNGHQRTGAVRAALQQALDHHKPGTTSFQLPSAGADLSRSDTRSFGESHAAELSNITAYTPPTPHPNIQVAGVSGGSTPIQQPMPIPQPAASVTRVPVPTFPIPEKSSSHDHVPLAHAPAQQSPPINPSVLNQAPAPLPESALSPIIPTSSPESTAPATAPIIIPTVAETGVPLSAGASGPGPAKGSLHDLKHASTQSGVLQSPPLGSVKEEKKPAVQNVSAPAPAPAPAAAPAIQHPTAEEEKRRLAAAYSQAHVPAPAPAPAPSTSHPHESAEEEKKRLEREERERILRGQAPAQQGQGKKDGEPDEDLPPYQEPTLQ
ncbi:hypothetical protein EST38_g5969 [Candolleomyces aberdarensis]|uniref:Eisosome component PIL1-domain-containing protein n=1 Tax=Candolleomyces aberdarensis TaxID=2316362 RepID=A0A4V1Q3V1_9AGAR|nr:hypothetical protein EST38_g5969 [Candolleomyces aberdarensis]